MDPVVVYLLPEIFKFLSAKDRKSVRLTCRQWSARCNDPIITKREKFVFRPCHDEEDDLSSLAERIQRCNVLRTDFEFFGLPLWQFPTCLWEHCGDSMKSIFIHECEMTDWTIFDVFLSCIELDSFHLQSLTHEDVLWWDNSNESRVDRVLNNLIELSVERRNLRSLQLNTCTKVTNTMCQKIFQIFPNICAFSRELCQRTWNNLWRDDLELEQNFLQDHQELEQVFLQDHQELEQVFLQDDLALEHMLEVRSPFQNQLDMKDGIPRILFARNFYPKLKNLELTLRIAHIANVYQLISKQTELEEIKLALSGGAVFQTKSILLSLLTRSSKLKKVVIHSTGKVRFQMHEFEEFLQKISNLESLVLDAAFRLAENSILSFNSPPSKLTRLEVNFGNETEKIYPHILLQCPFLQYLHLRSIDINMNSLRRICRHLPKLRTLRLFQRENRSDNNELRQLIVRSSCNTNAIHPLLSLEHLEIHNAKDHVMNQFLNEFSFPNLKSFRNDMSRNELETFKFLDLLSSRAPFLEFLQLYSQFSLYLLKTDEYMSCLKRLKRIKFLQIRLQEEIRQEYSQIIQYLFNEYSQLNFVDIGDEFIYFYDRSLEMLRWHKKFKVPSSIDDERNYFLIL